MWVEAEVGQVSMPASGHIYFTLKDDKSLLRCVLFKNKRYQAACLPEEGKTLLIRGKVSVYTQRGELQLIASYLEDAGEGALRREFELLKNKLQLAGYFEQAHKQAIPLYPRHIAIVTSASGAALQDALSTLANRYPVTKVTVFPTLVQGHAAAQEITDMLKRADQEFSPTVILLIRGGGSSEDLHAFNDEGLANQIFQSKTPIISGVGHETDFTIADFVADKRALTPTDAAILATPDGQQLQKNIQTLSRSLRRQMLAMLANRQQHKDFLMAKLVKPQSRVQHEREAIRALQQRMTQSLGSEVASAQSRLYSIQSYLERQTPLTQIARSVQAKDAMKNRLDSIWLQQHNQRNKSLTIEKSKLHTLSPLSTLNRGYAIMHRANGSIISDASTADKGELVHTRLRKGTINSEVV